MSFFQNYSDQLWVLLDVVIATVLSGAIGYEREKTRKPAGLRTNMIVGSVSCLFVSISSALIDFIADHTSSKSVDADPIRILQAIIVGISFIGAGTILKSTNEHSVSFLTTAATLLYSTGIGICVALHLYILAVGVTLLILFINLLNNLVNKVEPDN